MGEQKMSHCAVPLIKAQRDGDELDLVWEDILFYREGLCKKMFFSLLIIGS